RDGGRGERGLAGGRRKRVLCGEGGARSREREAHGDQRKRGAQGREQTLGLTAAQRDRKCYLVRRSLWIASLACSANVDDVAFSSAATPSSRLSKASRHSA